MTPEQAIAAAQANANNNANVIPATATQAVATTSQWAAPTLDSLMNQSMSVDAYIKLTETGISLKKDCPPKEALEKIRIVINTQVDEGFKPTWSMSYGDPAQYIESYDGVTTVKGESFSEAVAKAMAVDSKAKAPFQTAKVGCILLEEAHGRKEGTVLGLTFTRTGVPPWVTFLREAAKKGLLGKKVEVLLGYRVGTMPNRRPWGIPTFELVGEYFEHGGE